MYKLTVYIPDSHLDSVKEALFAAGAGRIGNYENCCWQVQGLGQFKPVAGSNPHLGEHDTLEQVNEWRVECVVADEYVKDVVTVMKLKHPYETPAYDVVKVESI